MIVLGSPELAKLSTRQDTILKVEEALLIQERGNFLLPERMHVHKDSDTLLLMPCFGRDYFITKLVSVYPGNINLSKPAVYGTLILNDNKTGEPLALMNASQVTSARTGALGAVAAKYLVAKNKIRLGVIGAGVQGYSQALHISEVMDVREICFFDNKRAAVKEKTSDYSTIFPEARVNPVSSVEELLELSDVVVTATTSRESVLPEKPDLLQGKTYIGVGSFKPGMQELPLALFGLLEKVYVDTLFAKQESGDLKIPLEKGKLKDSSVKTLGWHIETGKSGSGADDTKLFKSVGMALLDLVVAEHLYEKALSAGIGQKINL